MTNCKALLLSTLLVVACMSVSCDKEETGSDPAGTVALNMMNEENGKTVLGNSDVYIESGNNFYSYSCMISSLGRRNGLGSVSEPLLNGVSDRMAVEPGHGYQIFRSAALREFPSGALAMNIKADYYNVYVASSIKNGESVVGANVKYVLADVPVRGLPEYNKYMGRIDFGNPEITITLPTSDFEYEKEFASKVYYTIECTKNGNKLTFKLIDVLESDIFGVWLRIGSSYTYVYGEAVR